MVGTTKLAVSGFCYFSCSKWSHSLGRTWLLILGMSGIIVMFWFVENSIALRYFVSLEYLRGATVRD